MQTVEQLEALFKRANPGYWFVKQKGVRNGDSSEHLENVRDAEKQYADFLQLTEMLPVGEYEVNMQSSMSGSASKQTFKFRIGDPVASVRGIGNGVARDATMHNGGMLQFFQFMLEKESKSNDRMLEMVIANQKSNMEMMQAMLMKEKDFEIHKIKSDQNKTASDKIFGIAEKHFPVIAGMFGYNAPVAAIGRAKAEENATVPLNEERVKKTKKKSPLPELTPEEQQKRAILMGQRVKKCFDGLQSVIPELEPIDTMEAIVEALLEPMILNFVREKLKENEKWQK